MHEPRPGLGWSRQRILRRVAYGCWMVSPQWLEVRRGWYREWRQRYGRAPCCVVCGAPWSLRAGDLHHRTYRRLGQEHFADLVPVDRHCHDLIHAVLDSHPGWRRIERSQANDLIIGLLRNPGGLATEEALGLDR